MFFQKAAPLRTPSDKTFRNARYNGDGDAGARDGAVRQLFLLLQVLSAVAVLAGSAGAVLSVPVSVLVGVVPVLAADATGAVR